MTATIPPPSRDVDRRRRLLVKCLDLAVVSFDVPGQPKNPTWKQIVRRAQDISASYQPKVTADEYNQLGDMTIRQLFEPEG